VSWQPFSVLAAQFGTDAAQIESACTEMQASGLVEVIGHGAVRLTHELGMRAIVTHEGLVALDWGKITAL
jgi:hypothetical protein